MDFAPKGSRVAARVMPMRYLAGVVCVFALGMMPLVGCGPGPNGTGGSGGMVGSGGTGGGGTVECHVANDCSSGGECTVTVCAAGMCDTQTAADGTVCDHSAPGDGTCKAGTCGPSSCAPACTDPDEDDCTEPFCPEGATECSTQPAPEHSDCRDNNANGKCTVDGRCDLCADVTCAAPSQCQEDSSCNEDTGVCLPFENKDEGTPCTEGGGSYCDANGRCVQCNVADDCEPGGECTVTVCAASTCDTQTAEDGTTCDHSAPGDGQCTGGTCGPTSCVPACTDPDEDDCTEPVCLATECSTQPAPEHSDCRENGNAGQCTRDGRCVQCNVADDCEPGGACTTTVCDAGVCDTQTAEDGTTCDHSAPGDGTCTSGTCGPMTCVPACVDLDEDDCTEPICLATECSTQPAPEDSDCRDNGVSGKCTLDGRCDLCADVTCTAPSQCQEDSSCNEDTGECLPFENKDLGMPCTEGGGSYCDGHGGCVQCNVADDCDPGGECTVTVCAAGTCDTQPAEDGTTCDYSAPGVGTCVGGTCGPTTCVPACVDLFPDDCTEEICLEGATECSLQPAPEHSECAEDGGRYCDADGNCVQCTLPGHCNDDKECTDDDCANNMCAYPPKADGEPCSQGICLSGVCGTAPDLVVSSISIPSTTIVYGATPWTHVEFTVENVGSGPVTGVGLLGQEVNVTRDGAPHSTGRYFIIGYSDPLDPGETATHHFAVGHNARYPLGHYTLQVQVDHTDLVAESDETNNVSAQISFDVVESAPDLVVSSISIPSTTIVYGATPWTWVRYTVENVGSGPVTGVDLLAQLVNVTRDGAPHFTTGYMRITYSDPLDPGETAGWSFAVGHNATFPLGHYTLQVQVDHRDLVAESDETNNVSAQISFDVVAP